MIRNFTIILMLFGIVQIGSSQGLQYNQWEYAPLLLSPSKTGAYKGSFRVGAIIKDKFGTWDPESWKSVQGFIDAPIIRGARKSDWIAVGLVYDYDQAGTSKFRQSFQRLSLAYHLGFGKKLKSSLSIAGQLVNATRTISANEIDYESGQELRNLGNQNLLEFLATQGDEGPMGGYKTWVTSMAYSSQMSKTASMSFGLSVSQFLAENQAIKGVDPLPARYIGFFEMKNWTGKRNYFAPRIVYSRQGSNDKVYLQAMFGYRMKKDITLSYGLGLNALTTLNIPLYFGMDYKGIKAGLSYGIDLGAIEATGSYAGLELGASYIHILAKKPKPKPVIICPRL